MAFATGGCCTSGCCCNIYVAAAAIFSSHAHVPLSQCSSDSLTFGTSTAVAWLAGGDFTRAMLLTAHTCNDPRGTERGGGIALLRGESLPLLPYTAN